MPAFRAAHLFLLRWYAQRRSSPRRRLREKHRAVKPRLGLPLVQHDHWSSDEPPRARSPHAAIQPPHRRSYHTRSVGHGSAQHERPRSDGAKRRSRGDPCYVPEKALAVRAANLAASARARHRPVEIERVVQALRTFFLFLFFL